jgi:hypothetical protein
MTLYPAWRCRPHGAQRMRERMPSDCALRFHPGYGRLVLAACSATRIAARILGDGIIEEKAGGSRLCPEPYRWFCVAEKNRGSPVPNAAYFRRQADICLRLSVIASDQVVSTRLLAMARDYQATSEALELQAAGDPPAAQHHENGRGLGEGLPVRPETPEP